LDRLAIDVKLSRFPIFHGEVIKRLSFRLPYCLVLAAASLRVI
jgi:hypothetical protein